MSSLTLNVNVNPSDILVLVTRLKRLVEKVREKNRRLTPVEHIQHRSDESLRQCAYSLIEEAEDSLHRAIILLRDNEEALGLSGEEQTELERLCIDHQRLSDGLAYSRRLVDQCRGTSNLQNCATTLKDQVWRISDYERRVTRASERPFLLAIRVKNLNTQS
ncbi:hypothetical protein GYMLUDRAFT_35417 [Collybiopsis luxurians FD-317 M1]|nr:hypothetical protein GYMLUDRAFT_35417 [Collybiopsis luxurians FD-317 M1]